MSVQRDDPMLFDTEWVEMISKVRKGDVSSLFQHLRSDKPITKEIRNFLCNLFDPARPEGIYAKIVRIRGNKSAWERNYDLYMDVEGWKIEARQRRVPQKQWDIFRKKYSFASVIATKAGYAKGRKFSEMYNQINSL